MCGHDAHTTALLMFIEYLVTKMKSNDFKLKKGIVCLFQPAEEIGQGAKKVIEE